MESHFGRKFQNSRRSSFSRRSVACTRFTRLSTSVPSVIATACAEPVPNSLRFLDLSLDRSYVLPRSFCLLIQKLVCLRDQTLQEVLRKNSFPQVREHDLLTMLTDLYVVSSQSCLPRLPFRQQSEDTYRHDPTTVPHRNNRRREGKASWDRRPPRRFVLVIPLRLGRPDFG